MGLHHYFGILHNQDGCKRRPQFTPKEIPWYSFLLEAEWNVGLLNVDRRSRTPENFQLRNRNSNSEAAVLWCSTSTKYIALIRTDMKYDMQDARDMALTGQRISES